MHGKTHTTHTTPTFPKDAASAGAGAALVVGAVKDALEEGEGQNIARRCCSKQEDAERRVALEIEAYTGACEGAGMPLSNVEASRATLHTINIFKAGSRFLPAHT